MKLLQISVLFTSLYLFHTATVPAPVSITTGFVVEQTNFIPYETTFPLIFEMPVPASKEYSTHVEHLDQRYQQLMDLARSAILRARPLVANNGTARKVRESDGLLPFVGQIHNYLFGDATQREVN